MIHLQHIRQALQLADFDAPAAHRNMAPSPRPLQPPPDREPPRPAAVLVLIYPEADDDLHIVLTRRTAALRGHSGQISFPGGKRDPEDDTFIVTALRETCEELGLCEASIQIEGELSRFYIPPSHFLVHPVVGTVPHKPIFKPSPHEVAEVFAMPVRDLLSDAVKRHETRHFNGQAYSVPYYWVNEHKVWGATAAMLGELEARLRRVVPDYALPD